MKYLLILTFFMASFAEAAVYRGQIDFGSNSVTTAFEAVATISSEVKHVECSVNSVGSDIWVSVSGRQSDCSDANEDVLLADDGIKGFILDEYPVGGFICVKTDSGTVSAGIIQCLAYWRGGS